MGVAYLVHMRMVPTFEWCLLKLVVYDFSKYEIFFVKNSNEMKIKWKNTQERKWDKIIKLVAMNIHLWLNISKSKLCLLFHNVSVRQWWIKEFTPLKWNNWMFFMHPPFKSLWRQCRDIVGGFIHIYFGNRNEDGQLTLCT